MAAAGIRMGKVFVEIGADSKKFFRAINRVNNRIGQLGQSMTALGGKMAGVGAALSVPLGLVSRQFAGFDDAIRATAAVTGNLGAEGAASLQLLTDKARQLGASTSFTAVEVANLMTELGRAGFSATEINDMTESVLALARATGTDASLSAGILAATLRQFSLEAGDAARVADILTTAANSTFNTVEGLGESLKFAGPVAKSLGMSLEDTVAVLGVLGNVGIQGSEAGTALRRLSTIAAGSGEQLQNLFGVQNTDAAGELKPLVQILDDINTATADMPVAERTAKMAKAFGLLGITSANVLSQSAGGVTDLANKLRNADGAATSTAQAMDAGLGGAMRKAMSAIEGTALAIGEALAPMLQSLIETITNVAGGITAFVKDNQELIVSIAKGVGIFTAAGAAILTTGFALSSLSTAAGLALTATASIVGGFASIVTGAVGVLFSMAAIIVKMFAVKVASVGAALATQAAWIAASWPILAAIGVIGIFIKETIQSEKAADLLGSAIGGVTSEAKTLYDELSKAKDIGVSTFGEIFQSIKENDLEGAISVAMKGLTAAFTVAGNGFLNAVDRWGVNLLNAFDFYISSIPFLRFLGPDQYKFSLFGDSTQDTNADQRADNRFAELDKRAERRRQQSGEVQQDFSRFIIRRQADREFNQEVAQKPGAVNTLAMTPAEQARADAFTNMLKGFTAQQIAANEAQAAARPQDEERQRMLQQAVEQAEVTGTFSSVGIGGMGFGGSLQQQQLDEARKTNKLLTERLEPAVIGT